ncbi:MAG: lyase, partial [Nonomuraea sp.]|nr:lyase [Nonomuraea sp.]
HRSARGWVAALSMSSYRVARYEHGNGENLRGWHTGDGMLYWWAEGHREQYAGTFWQTVDPYRLPGTTVSTRRLPDGAGKPWGDNCPDARWVGGVTDGTYAAVGQHLLGLESSLEAFKSWFFLDDAVVCLGAGISCSDGVPVETVVDNRRAAGPLAVHPGWAHLEGHGGYVVRDGRLRAQRGGAYVTLWLDHGVDPGGGTYAYLLMPGATADETRARAWDPGWAVILANSAAQQAIRVPSLDLTAVNFWQPGTVAGLTADAPCAVLIGGNTVTVADVREDLDSLTLSWNTGRKVTIPLNNQRRIWRIPG